MRQTPELPAVPLLISSRNAEAVIGQTWRWLRDHAADLGLEILTVDGKRFIDAAAALDAIKRRAAVQAPPAPPPAELEKMRARIGKRLRAGNQGAR